MITNEEYFREFYRRISISNIETLARRVVIDNSDWAKHWVTSDNVYFADLKKATEHQIEVFKKEYKEEE